MNKKLFSKISHFLVLFVVLISSQTAFSQLSDFSLTVAKTDETCTGNGTLTFNIQNSTSGATFIYSVYLLPDTLNPVAVLSGTTMTGLSSGTYRIVALQTLGNFSNSQQQDVVIQNQIVPLTFQVAGTAESCTNGIITVTAQGNPVFYETITGPVIVPPQSSNVFPNLVAGTYNIRVTDSCGDAYVQTYTLQGTTYLYVKPLQLGCQLPACNLIPGTFVVHTDEVNMPESKIVYPLTVTITVYPPGNGAPVLVNQTVASGDLYSQAIASQIPFYPGQHYFYDIAVTDSCGHLFSSIHNEVFEQYTVTIEPQPSDAVVNALTIKPCHGVPPYRVTFLSAPAGFVPKQNNNAHPVFNSTPIHYESTPQFPMPDGDYVVSVTDACGSTVVETVDLEVCVTDYKVIPICVKLGEVHIPSATGVRVVTAIITEATADLGQPLPYDISSMIVGGYLQINLPVGEYTVEGVNICGDPYKLHIAILEPYIAATGANVKGCATNTGSINIELMEGQKLTSVVITQAPVGFNHPLPYDVSSFISAAGKYKTCVIPGLIYGNYVLNITDSCGSVYSVTVTVPLLVSNDPPIVNILAGCSAGFGSIRLISNNDRLQQVIITAAPAGYTGVIPQDVTVNIATNGFFYMNSLPEGVYTFYTKDSCGIEHTFQRTIDGSHIVQSNIDVVGNCGSFDLRLDFEGGPSVSVQTFWLQKFNPLNGVWEHPITGVDYNGGIPLETNSHLLLNHTTTYNIATTGSFRIVKTTLVFSNGSISWTVCVETIKTFEFTEQLKVPAAYTIPCSNGASQVFIVAGDNFPLTYTITQKNGTPFFVDNGNSNVFSGLTPGIYNFQVQDLCGNIVNRLFDIISLSEPAIVAANLCNGKNGQLSVQAFPYLSYQWWNGANPGIILSTTNTLNFSPFSTVTAPGTYYVRVYSQTSLSCIDTTLSYTIPPVLVPNAGQDATTTLCGSNTAVDLFAFLGGTFHYNGQWEEVTDSGMLNGHTWLPVGIVPGTYIFRYRVNGFCDDFDEALVTIEFKGTVPTPVITVSQEPCTGGSIVFEAATIPNATYHWNGPDNFVSDQQNPIITNSTVANAGQYSVTASVNGCTMTASVNIAITAALDFSIEQGCVAGAYVLKAEPVNGSFDINEVTYSWTGPQNFSSSSNPVTITDLPAGSYALTVTTDKGCEVSKSIGVQKTKCIIPPGISPNDDGDNDTFDLTGFDVLEFKIYNRYGRMVFEHDNYTNQWHGQDFNGHILPDATYYYYIRMRAGEQRTGWVYVSK